jgi:hypothetical protein
MRRVADAVLAGDYITAMAEATADALMQAMQFGGGMMNLPPPERCDIEPLDSADGAHRFRVAFYAAEKHLSATVAWSEVEGAWKITSISDIEVPGFEAPGT